MFFLKNIKAKSLQLRRVFTLLTLIIAIHSTAWAGGPPAPSSLNNPLALTLITLMLILLIIIFMLGRLLTGIAEIKLQREKEKREQKASAKTIVTILTGMLLSSTVMAQDANAGSAETIGGISITAFYIMIGVLFIEMLVILALLINIRFLLQKEETPKIEISPIPQSSGFSKWWARINKFKPVEKEREIELDHDYDGIRELDNRLPPWWLWGFYVSIIFSVVYLWRYHVAYSAPLSKEELEISVKKADEEVKAYLAMKGETVDENTVTQLADPQDLAEGKKIFTASCVACHKDDGGGLVGPNLTDDYWLHGGSIKNVFKTIKYGINAMPAWQSNYSNKQLAQVASYVKSLQGSNPPGAKTSEGELYKEEAAQ